MDEIISNAIKIVLKVMNEIKNFVLFCKKNQCIQNYDLKIKTSKSYREYANKKKYTKQNVRNTHNNFQIL